MSIFSYQHFQKNKVLIVAKCIVNDIQRYVIRCLREVLIVAKCIVNVFEVVSQSTVIHVLIVAKCIVNNLFYHVLEKNSRY